MKISFAARPSQFLRSRHRSARFLREILAERAPEAGALVAPSAWQMSPLQSSPHAPNRVLIYATALAGLVTLIVPRSAEAIPAFARKYGTSCTTCHTVYPKLTPFGEAFRHNGFRFPGTDSDVIKQPQVSMGSDAYKKLFPDAVYPGTLPGIPPLSLGFNGQIVIHPDTSNSGGRADNGAAVVADDLIEEAHIWAGGNFDDAMTFFGELTVSADGIEIEKAIVNFCDLIGPDHYVNLTVGKHSATLTSFGPHSTYLGDTAVPGIGVTGLFGATSDSWNLLDNFPILELNGVFEGIVDYAVGIAGGTNVEVRSMQNVYAHVGVKIGGMRMDAEQGSAVPDAARPWAETALTLSGYFYHSSSRFSIGDPASTSDMPLPDLTFDDNANVVGGQVRAQWMSLELDAGVSFEAHDHPGAADGKANVLTQWDELSYVVFPWLVPAVRFEYTHVAPDGGTAVNDTRIAIGAAALVRPNLKLVVTGQLETATGAPPGGWGPANGVAEPTDPTQSVSLEIESIVLGLAFAY
jgi:hypothetical protein